MPVYNLKKKLYSRLAKKKTFDVIIMYVKDFIIVVENYYAVYCSKKK